MQVLIVHREGVLCILLIVKLAPQADTRSNRASLGSADIPRNLKISKHTGENNHLQYFDNVLKQWSPPCGPCGLYELFPNVCISLRIFVKISAPVASAERFFSKLKLVKNYLRSAISQTREVERPARSTCSASHKMRSGKQLKQFNCTRSYLTKEALPSSFLIEAFYVSAFSLYQALSSGSS